MLYDQIGEIDNGDPDRSFESPSFREAASSVMAAEPTKGTFLDETISLRDPEGGELITAVMEILSDYRVLERARQARYVENDRSLLGCMLANGLRCHWHRQPTVVSYFRKADAKAYREKRNKPVWLSGAALSREAELLARAGLSELFAGERFTSSGFMLSPQLLEVADRHGVTIHSLRRSIHPEDLVRLKEVRPQSTFDVFTMSVTKHEGDRIYFEPTGETDIWRNELAAFNDFLAAQNIEVCVSEEIMGHWIDKLNGDVIHTGARFSKPELFRNAVYRVFNDGRADDPRFDMGGRLSSGWWMNAPREVRPFIVINGQPTIELDYEACHPRMLYHEQGLECLHDPYDIAEVNELYGEEGLSPDEARGGVKWIFKSLINGRRRPNANEQPSKIVIPTATTPADLSRLVERNHPGIAHAFWSGDGLRLMRPESDIAQAVVTRAQQRSFLALPLHDSFISPKEKSVELHIIMREEYFNVYHQYPVIN